MLDKLSATAMEYFSVKCCLRHIWNQLSRTIKHALLDIRMGNILNCYFIESNQSCLRITAITGRKRHIKNPVKNLRCSFLAKIINGFRPLVTHTKKFHCRCFLGSKHASSVTVIVILLHRNVFGNVF